MVDCAMTSTSIMLGADLIEAMHAEHVSIWLRQPKSPLRAASIAPTDGHT